MGQRDTELLKGTLDLLILQVLSAGTRHGWSISRRLRDLSDELFDVNQGSLYPALHRLEAQGWIEAEWGISELGRRAKFYRMTRRGRRRLRTAAGEWQRFAATLDRMMQTHPEEQCRDEPAEASGLPSTQAVES